MGVLAQRDVMPVPGGRDEVEEPCDGAVRVGGEEPVGDVGDVGDRGRQVLAAVGVAVESRTRR
ncbi:hypothetical protein OG883_14340 [Streptomyces sp. NBC_01142]|uniref:hypothetical protein n=1 Tax=Streptomyces sp. NBC_01142 TaxID=2975865 RepID=UPI0022510989|nr:hypothetical protein [Streptomyces sp. NBC_01142]MCX4821072.1 hypothetical protein [Streptomyces sp. NBC_01142]